MLEPLDKPPKSQRKRPTCSLIAICCPVVLIGIVSFLMTPQGQAFNAQLFDRYYTAGALLMLGFYGAVGLCLVVTGLTLAVIARIRREMPFWLPYLALTVNVVTPLAVLRYLR